MATAPRLDPTEVAEIGARLAENISLGVKAPERVVRELIIALLADGHVLIEDAPGVGKTALARALARSLEAEYARVQCTSDLLPADLVGTNVSTSAPPASVPPRPGVRASSGDLDQPRLTEDPVGAARVRPGAPGDRRDHTAGSPVRRLGDPNPACTRAPPPPEAELDRFMVRVSLGYPEAKRRRRCSSSMRIATGRTVAADHRRGRSPCGAGSARRHRGDRGAASLVAVCEATRRDERVAQRQPRAPDVSAARRSPPPRRHDHVLPDDVQALAPSVLSHRLLLSYEVDGDQREAVVREAIDTVPAL
jgi:MoxR-like ATPase